MSHAGIRRRILRERAFGQVSRLTGKEPTGIKSLDKLMNLKTNRTPLRLPSGRIVWVAPGQYVKGMKIKK